VPDLALERACDGLVAGVDEAGRGPLAGPVLAAATIIDTRCITEDLLSAIDDSKRLTPACREAVFAALPACAQIGIGAASVAEIDALNILQATMLAMRRAVAALRVVPDLVLVDGNRVPPALPCAAQPVVGGDGISISIAAASIVAKVVRDRAMARLALRHPGFGWEHNAGYGTADHRSALEMLGPTQHHRRSFAPVAKFFL
jgi:ribonuclease HII